MYVNAIKLYIKRNVISDVQETAGTVHYGDNYSFM